MYKLGINFDEISDDLDIALGIMKQNNVMYGELRTVNQKNFVFWTDEEVDYFAKRVFDAKVEIVAAASPLFKWFIDVDSPAVVHDSFGFNPRLSDEEKEQTITRAIEVAARLSIPRIRIFSGLGVTAGAGKQFANDPLLAKALELADQNNIDLYIENEPVCRVNKKRDLIDLLKYNNNPRLKLWLDIANMVELDEIIDEEFIAEIAPRLGYIHVKDFTLRGGKKKYVPVGEGIIDYSTILTNLISKAANDIVLTVETHATEHKQESSTRAIIGTRNLLREQGVIV